MRILSVALLAAGCLPLAAQQPPGKPAPSQLLAQPRLGADTDKVNSIIVSLGGQLRHTIPGIQVHVITVPAPALEHVQKSLLRSGMFTYVEQDALGQTVATPNDPSFSSQWHLAKVQAPSAWNITTGSMSAPVAVIDSGADSTHPDLSSRLVAGWNFLNASSNTSDTMGHGTAVAGTVAAATNNGLGVAGLSWGNPVMPLVAADSTGYASYSNIASGITYAADHGARVINISIAGSSASSVLQSAVDYAWNKGVVVFAAAGNSSTSAVYYPAGCNNVVAVSSTTSSDTLSGFSNFGSWIDLAAPGEYILTTTRGGGYGSWSGTSFASPITAGIAALVLSLRPSLSASGLVSLLEQHTDDIGPAGFDNSFGFGRVNAYKAVSAAAAYVGDTTAPTVSISTPSPGSTLAGTVAVSGVASDQVGVVKVEFRVDGAVSSSISVSSTSAPFSFSWNTAAKANGSHTVSIAAYDAQGNVGQASVTVSVNNPVVLDTTPPTETITSPANGSTLPLKVKVSAVATDNVAVTQVSIYLDGVLQYTGTAAPYTFSLNTNKLAKGKHIITGNAWDKAGNTASAAPVTVYK